MPDTTPPDNTDNVTAQHDCSIDGAFEALKENMQSHVNAYNENKSESDRRVKFEDKGYQFDVVIPTNIRTRTKDVVFLKWDDSIEIERKNKAGLDTDRYFVYPYMDEDGSCKFNIEEDESKTHKAYELEQVMEFALKNYLS